MEGNQHRPHPSPSHHHKGRGTQNERPGRRLFHSLGVMVALLGVGISIGFANSLFDRDALSRLVANGDATNDRGHIESLPLDALQAAAKDGNSHALFRLASMHATGSGVPLNPSEAGRLFLLAAQKGHAEAQLKIGHIYSQGWGELPKDHTKAKAWYRQAAYNDDPESQVNLAWSYTDNSRGYSDLIRAAVWMRLAKVNGNSSAKRALDELQDRLTKDEEVLAENTFLVVQNRISFRKAQARRLSRFAVPEVPEGSPADGIEVIVPQNIASFIQYPGFTHNAEYSDGACVGKLSQEECQDFIYRGIKNVVLPFSEAGMLRLHGANKREDISKDGSHTILIRYKGLVLGMEGKDAPEIKLVEVTDPEISVAHGLGIGTPVSEVMFALGPGTVGEGLSYCFISQDAERDYGACVEFKTERGRVSEITWLR